MEHAYIDQKRNQAICCWNAPDQKSIEDLFNKVQVKTEMIREVVEYTA